jgi:hypothetical protein
MISKNTNHLRNKYNMDKKTKTVEGATGMAAE